MKPPFLTRHPDRDRDTDRRRLSRLRSAVAEVLRDVAAERDGFEARYRKASADAAFSQDRLDDGGPSDALSARVTDLTRALIRYRDRISQLDRQIVYLESLQDNVDSFIADRRKVEGDGAAVKG